tara:strand:+ start:2989 stop:3477 length:489 start_codon:yes stop_codon:yes gene_type:complete
MPYQSWYSAATNAAVDMNMPPALVPSLNSAVAPVRQPITPINANVPSTDNITEDANTGNSRDNSIYARSNLRTAGRFDKETAMITPQETQRMMFGDQAFRNTRRITEERDMSKDYNFVDRRPTMTQQEMAAQAGPSENYSNDFEGYENTSNPFSDQYSSLWS